jgi:hypothetical protein
MRAESIYAIASRSADHARMFTVTDTHLALLRRAVVDWNDDTDTGAPTISPQRPYGTGHVLVDVAEVADPDAWRELAQAPTAAIDAYVRAHEAWLTMLHAETAVALQIALSTGRFAAGRYVKRDLYDNTSWTSVDGDE